MRSEMRVEKKKKKKEQRLIDVRSKPEAAD